MATFTTFEDQQLNYFKFLSIVLDEFTNALRQTFISLWDSKYGSLPGYQPWDDSLTVRTIFQKLEGRTVVPPSIKEWDYNELLRSIIFSSSFGTAVSGGKKETLSELYIAPLKLSEKSLLPNVVGKNQDESITLSVDQLRRLRNKACHSSSTKKIDKDSFDSYIQRTKDAFAALGVSTTSVDNIVSLTENDFPTGRVRALEEQIIQVLVHQVESNASDDGWEDIRGIQNDQEDTGKLHFAIGRSYNNLNDFNSALNSHMKALSIREKLLGDHEDTAKSHYVLGCTYNILDDFSSSLEEHKKALSIREKLLGDHEETAWSHFEVGCPY